MTKIFSLETKSISLFRLLLGSILVIDSIQKFLLMGDFYSDSGVMPRIQWMSQYMNSFKWSFHLASASDLFLSILFLIQIISFIFYTLGYRSKTFGLIGLVFLMSLHARNNLILSGADELMKFGLLFSLFLPLDGHFAYLPKKEGAPHWLPGFSLMAQLSFMYLFTAFIKWHPIWHTEGSAIYYALNIDLFVKSFGLWIKSFPNAMKWASFFTLAFEFIGPLVAFIPGRVRLWTALLFIAFHFCLYLSLEIGLFPWVCMVYWVVFFPFQFWNSRFGQLFEHKLNSLFNFFQNLKPLNRNETTPFLHFRLKLALNAFLISVIFLFNLGTLNLQWLPIPNSIKNTAYFLNVNQIWNMFAPYPMKNDGWFVIEGTFDDQSTLDLVWQKAVTYSKPTHPASAFKNGEWRKYMVNLWDESKNRILLPFGNYLCLKNHAKGGKTLLKVKIDFVKETTPPPGDPWQEPEIINLWNHDCSK